MKRIFFLVFTISISLAIQTMAQNPAMKKVKGGSFTMGGTEYYEKPDHTVTISSFKMGKYEVTVGEFKAFCKASGRDMPAAPSWGWNDQHPMVNINFDEANAYCIWLSESTGKNYRLPTEAEWEYAARGGKKSKGYTFAGSNDLDEVGWSYHTAGGQTQVRGSKKPNELGLYDMSGNVWEWCSDWYDASYYGSSPSTNPKGPASGTVHVLRGGSWSYLAADCRVANRNHFFRTPEYRGGGLRVVVSK